MNQPTDALKTIESAGELLARGIDIEKAKLKDAIKALEDFQASIAKHLSVIREARNGENHSNNRFDDRAGVRDPFAALGAPSGRMSDLS
jgi:hypothetical protein